MLLIETPDFKLAASYAKAVAESNAQTELTQLIFFVGAKLAASEDKYAEPITAIADLDDKITSLINEANLKVADNKEPITDKSFPLASALKLAIGENKQGSLNDLLLTLAKNLKLIPETAADKENPISLGAIAEDPVFIVVDRYAKGLSKKFSYDETKPEVYALAALVALNRGDLADRPALSAHISAYAREYNSWIDEQGWQDLNDLCQFLDDSDSTTQIGTTHPLHNFSKEKNPFIALLNDGIEKVSQTRSIECVAYHEAGHAIVSLALRPKVQIEKVTIVPNERYDGCVFFDDTNPIFKHVFPSTREDFLEDLCVSLAGQASQLKKYGFNAADIGAQSDFAGATEYAWRYITEFGLDEGFGPLHLGVLGKKFGIKSGWLFDEAQRRLQSLLKEAQQKTEIILAEHWEDVERVVAGLLVSKTLDEDEVRALIFPTKN